MATPFAAPWCPFMTPFGDVKPTLNTDGGFVDPFFLPLPPPPPLPPASPSPPPPPFATPFRFDPRAPSPFLPARRLIHRIRSATSLTPFAGSVAAILMYLHRLLYSSAPYVSMPRSSTACSSADHCASYRFVPVVPACDPDATASAAASPSISTGDRSDRSIVARLGTPVASTDAAFAGGAIAPPFISAPPPSRPWW